MIKMIPNTTKLLSFLAIVFPRTKPCEINFDPLQVTNLYTHYEYPTIDYTMGTVQNYPLTISTNSATYSPITLVEFDPSKPLWADLVDFTNISGSDYQLELKYEENRWGVGEEQEQLELDLMI